MQLVSCIMLFRRVNSLLLDCYSFFLRNMIDSAMEKSMNFRLGMLLFEFETVQEEFQYKKNFNIDLIYFQTGRFGFSKDPGFSMERVKAMIGRQ